MKLSRTSSPSHRREVQGILHDLVYSQNFFLNSLARALQNDFIRCLQWSYDGRCVCVDKTQSLAEFEHYLNLTRSCVTLECYNRLMSRLIENQFQLASCSTGLPSQVACYFHPSFNRSTYDMNLQLLSPVNNTSRCLFGNQLFMTPCPPNPHHLNPRYNRPTCFNQVDFFRGLCNRAAAPFGNSFNVKSSPCKLVQPHGSGLNWNGVKMVPLSFFSRASSSAIVSPIIEEVEEETSDDSSSDDVTPSAMREQIEEAETAPKLRAMQTQSTTLSQKRILDFFFNPRQKKQNYISSWLDSCHFEEVLDEDVWNSAVLMPSGLKKHKQFKPIPNKFALQNSHLVDVFGNAYINWKQQRNCGNKTSVNGPESSGMSRFNYSSLYEEATPRDILVASRDEKQIEDAVKSIIN